MKRITNCETVEIKTTNTSTTKFYFDEYPNLRGKVIRRVDVHIVDDLTHSPTYRPVINNLVRNKSFLVLVSQGRDVVNRVHFLKLCPHLNGGLPILLNLVIDFPKSYIEVGTIADLAAAESFVLTFYYLDPDFVNRIPVNTPILIENIEFLSSPTTISKFYFPDNENLRGKLIRSLHIPFQYQFICPTGDNSVNTTVMKYAYVTLVSKNREIVSKLPYLSFCYQIFPFQNEIKLGNVEIDFPKSFIEVPVTSGLVATEKFFFNIVYHDKVLTLPRIKFPGKPNRKLC